jgi:hypothetical protein
MDHALSTHFIALQHTIGPTLVHALVNEHAISQQVWKNKEKQHWCLVISNSKSKMMQKQGVGSTKRTYW